MRPLRLLALAALAVGLGAAAALPAADGDEATHGLQHLKLHGRFLHITDLHPDEFYRAHSSRGKACHRGKGLAGTYGAEKTDCDSPWSLVNATFDWIEHHVRDRIDFVVWTGDSARHDSDEKHPRTVAGVLDSNRAVAAKFEAAFAAAPGRPAIPVVPTFGNNDFLPHNIMTPGPNEWFRAYSDIWRRFVPEEQRHSFDFGGWFYVDVIPGKLAVLSLNTMYFFDRNAAVDGCADPSEPGYHHLEWLRVQLQRMRELGIKAILMGHVPPARTNSKQNWDETCWQRYTLWLRQYRDVVTASLFGHMNIDHFLLHDSREIDLAPDPDEASARRSLRPRRRLSAQTKKDYLKELRDAWSDLPDPVGALLDHDDGVEETTRKKRKNKFDTIGGKHAERYQLSLVSPSIVPNYFPTLRVFEYNITGLEQATRWQKPVDGQQSPLSERPEHWGVEADGEHEELRRQATAEKKRKKGKDKEHDDFNLTIPEAPPEGSLPGPAYRPQPFTLTGYVQYFANLTYINNVEGADAAGWRGRNLGRKGPKHTPAQPRTFGYEVEYSTFDDELYKLRDLTVKNYLHLAYRMGKKGKRKGKRVEAWDDDCDEDDEDDYVLTTADGDEAEEDCDDEVDGDDTVVDDEAEEDSDDDDDDDDDDDNDTVDTNKKKKEKKKHRQREENKTWLHFLSHAFVKTVPDEDLEKI